MDKEFEEGNFEESDEEKYVVSDDDDLPHKCGICKKQVEKLWLCRTNAASSGNL